MNVAIPAILTGCVMVPFCESRIDEMERVQSKVATFALGSRCMEKLVFEHFLAKAALAASILLGLGQ